MTNLEGLRFDFEWMQNIHSGPFDTIKFQRVANLRKACPEVHGCQTDTMNAVIFHWMSKCLVVQHLNGSWM